jgi:hypothetical protein
VADDQLRPAFQSLVTATGDVATSQGALSLAMDISAGTGRDLEAVSLALAKGFSGSTTALGKLGAGIDANIIKSKDMDAITGALSEKFAGQASAAADTYQGKLNKLSIAVDEGKELIGGALLKAVDDISEAFGGTGGMADAVDDSSQAMADLIGGISMSIQPIADFFGGVNKSTGPTFDFADALKLAYLQFTPLILKMEGFVDAKADVRIAMEEQSARSAVLTARLVGLAGAYAYATGAAISFGNYQNAPDGKDWANFYAVNQSGSKAWADAQNNVNDLVDEYNEGLKNVGTSSVGAAKDTFTFKEALQQVNSEGLEKLNANLKKAQDEFDGFRDSVAGGLTGQLDPEAALKSLAKRETLLAETKQELADYQGKITGEATETQLKELAKLQGAYNDAAASAERGAKTIVGEFVAQSGGIVEFGNQLQALLLTELSPEAFNLVREQNAVVGSMMATELLGANGATLIAQMNTAVEIGRAHV